jgi:hypothetical protein
MSLIIDGMPLYIMPMFLYFIGMSLIIEGMSLNIITMFSIIGTMSLNSRWFAKIKSGITSVLYGLSFADMRLRLLNGSMNWNMQKMFHNRVIKSLAY